VPQVANMVVGGKTPLLPQAELADIGFSLVLYANTALQAAMKAMSEAMAALKRDGGVHNVIDRLAGFEERQRLVAKDDYDALEAKYAVECGNCDAPVFNRGPDGPCGTGSPVELGTTELPAIPSRAPPPAPSPPPPGSAR